MTWHTSDEGPHGLAGVLLSLLGIVLVAGFLGGLLALDVAQAVRYRLGRLVRGEWREAFKVPRVLRRGRA